MKTSPSRKSFRFQSAGYRKQPLPGIFLAVILAGVLFKTSPQESSNAIGECPGYSSAVFLICADSHREDPAQLKIELARYRQEFSLKYFPSKYVALNGMEVVDTSGIPMEWIRSHASQHCGRDLWSDSIQPDPDFNIRQFSENCLDQAIAAYARKFHHERLAIFSKIGQSGQEYFLAVLDSIINDPNEPRDARDEAKKSADNLRSIRQPVDYPTVSRLQVKMAVMALLGMIRSSLDADNSRRIITGMGNCSADILTECVIAQIDSLWPLAWQLLDGTSGFMPYVLAEHLGRIIDTSKSDIREEAIRRLTSIESYSASRTLERLNCISDPVVRKSIAANLSDHGKAGSLGALLKIVDHDSGEARDTLMVLVKSFVLRADLPKDTLQRMNKSADATLRTIALFGLVKKGNPLAINAVVNSLKGFRPWEKTTALELLKEFRSEKITSAVLPLVHDKYFESKAIDVLGNQTDSAAVAFFIRRIKSDNDKIAVTCLRKISALPPEIELNYCLRNLRSPREDVRMEAVNDLAKLGAKESLDSLKRIAKDIRQPEAVRETAKGAIVLLKSALNSRKLVTKKKKASPKESESLLIGNALDRSGRL
jgi:uncharacterized protein (UPF0147 family)